MIAYVVEGTPVVHLCVDPHDRHGLATCRELRAPHDTPAHLDRRHLRLASTASSHLTCIETGVLYINHTPHWLPVGARLTPDDLVSAGERIAVWNPLSEPIYSTCPQAVVHLSGAIEPAFNVLGMLEWCCTGEATLSLHARGQVVQRIALEPEDALDVGPGATVSYGQHLGFHARRDLPVMPSPQPPAMASFLRFHHQPASALSPQDWGTLVKLLGDQPPEACHALHPSVLKVLRTLPRRTNFLMHITSANPDNTGHDRARRRYMQGLLWILDHVDGALPPLGSSAKA